MRILLFPALLLLLSAQAPPLTMVAESTAPIAWNSTVPVAGELCKVRVPTGVVQELAKPGVGWELRAGAARVPAALTGLGTGKKLTMSLPYRQTSAVGAADLVVVIDRGAAAQSINELSFKFEAAKVLCPVALAGSRDDKLYEPLLGTQLVYQEVTGGRILALTDITVEPKVFRYIRATFAGAGGAKLKEVLAADAPEPIVGKEVAVTLGPATVGRTAKETVWPLIFDKPQELVTRLELFGEAPGVARQLDIANLDAQGQPLSTLASFVWADGLQSRDASRSEYGVSLEGYSGAQRIGIVDSSGAPMLKFTSAKAFTTDCWLVFAMPQAAELALWLTPSGARQVQPMYNADNAREVGVVGFLASKVPQPAPEAPSLIVPAGAEGYLAMLQKWWRVAAYGIGALILTVLAVVLLRQPRQAQE